MKRKEGLAKIRKTAAVFAFAFGLTAAWKQQPAAADVIKQVVLVTDAISTDAYTVKEDALGSRKIWDGTNGQYLYLGGIKMQLLSKEGENVMLRTAEHVQNAYHAWEITDAHLWNHLSTVEKSLVQTMNLPEESYTYGDTVYTALAKNNVNVYQMSLNDVFRYYGGLTDYYDGYTRSECFVNKYWAYKEHEWVNYPIYAAVNLDLSNVFFSTAADYVKPSGLKNVDVVDSNGTNKMTLMDGTGFEAKLVTDCVEEGGQVTVNVTALPNDNSIQYTQISAMIVDNDDNVIAYGKVADVKTGEITFNLPSAVHEGDYIVALFGENVSDKQYATDSASTPAAFELEVTSDGIRTVSVQNLSSSNLMLAEGSGEPTQNVTPGEAIKPIVYEVSSYLEPAVTNTYAMEFGYYLPKDCLNGMELAGLTAVMDEKRATLTISGIPSRDVNLVTPKALKQNGKIHVGGVIYPLGDGKLGGTTADMIWYIDVNDVKSCVDGVTQIGITDQDVTICYRPTIENPVTSLTDVNLGSCYKIETEYDTSAGTVKVTVNGGETGYAEANNQLRRPKVEAKANSEDQYAKITVINQDTKEEISLNDEQQFWMPSSDVKIKVDFVSKTHKITVQPAVGGTASVQTEAAKGTIVQLQATPQDDYELVGWKVISETDSSEITVKEQSFKMPNSDVTVTPIFKLNKASEEKAAAVENAIVAIGTVEYSVECKEKIDAARSAYDTLTDGQKTLVAAEKLTVLENAEKEYQRLESEVQKEKAAAKEVEDLIDAIGTVAYNNPCRDAIAKAWLAYDILTPNEKRWVTDEKYKTLEAAEKQYEELKKQAEMNASDKAAADMVVRVIEAIGEVKNTDESKKAITSARTLYNTLTENQKAFVPAEKLAILINAEAEYERLQNQPIVDAVVKKIDAIGTVEYTDTAKAAIAAARSAYNTLNTAQKAMIPAEKLTILTNAESRYSALAAAVPKTKLEQTKATTNSVTITWKEDKKATDGYRIYIKGGKFKKFTKVTDVKKSVLSYTVKKVGSKKLTAGTQYELKIMSLAKNGKKTAELSAQKLKVVTVTAAPSISSAKRSKNGTSVALKWKKSSGATGYEIQMSTKKSSDFEKITNLKAKTKSYTKKNLNKSQTYYFRMRTYKTINGKVFYSGWSKVKKVNKK